MKLFFHAPNVHQGGGAVLINELLTSATNDFIEAQLDERLHIPLGLTSASIFRVQHTLWSRIKAEWRLRTLSTSIRLICFGSLPPLFGSSAEVFVFIQNRLLVDESSLSGYPWGVKARLFIERHWLRLRASNRMQLIVQTPSMAELVFNRLGIRAWVLSLMPTIANIGTKHGIDKIDFVYVASGDAHKNHRNLIDAWRILSTVGLKPSLGLTLSKVYEPKLVEWINLQIAKYDLNIQLLGRLDRTQILELYSNSKCQIYPSLLESFGLPLVEAATCGLPIIASERDFVRDVCSPCQTFDPESSTSISRAVMRFLGLVCLPQQCLTAPEFLKKLSAETP